MKVEKFAFDPKVGEAGEFPKRWRWAGRAIYKAIQGRAWDRVEVTFQKAAADKQILNTALTTVRVSRSGRTVESLMRMEVTTADGLAKLATSAADELDRSLGGADDDA